MLITESRGVKLTVSGKVNGKITSPLYPGNNDGRAPSFFTITRGLIRCLRQKNACVAHLDPEPRPTERAVDILQSLLVKILLICLLVLSIQEPFDEIQNLFRLNRIKAVQRLKNVGFLVGDYHVASVDNTPNGKSFEWLMRNPFRMKYFLQPEDGCRLASQLQNVPSVCKRMRRF